MGAELLQRMNRLKQPSKKKQKQQDVGVLEIVYVMMFAINLFASKVVFIIVYRSVFLLQHQLQGNVIFLKEKHF